MCWIKLCTSAISPLQFKCSLLLSRWQSVILECSTKLTSCGRESLKTLFTSVTADFINSESALTTNDDTVHLIPFFLTLSVNLMILSATSSAL